MNKHGVIACYSFLTNIETLHSAVNGVGSVLFVTCDAKWGCGLRARWAVRMKIWHVSRLEPGMQTPYYEFYVADFVITHFVMSKPNCIPKCHFSHSLPADFPKLV